MARLDLYDFVAQCREDGLSSAEAVDEWYRMQAELVMEREEAYWSDPVVWDGWHQQDVIDMYRRER